MIDRSYVPGRRMWGPLLALVAFSGIMPAVGQNSETAPAVIEFTVVDAGEGRALPGIRVAIDDLGLRSTTDQEGRVEFRSISPGRHRITARGPGYLAAREAEAPPAVDGFDVIIEPGAILRQQIRLVAAGVIAGQVFDGDGAPLEQVLVSALLETLDAGQLVLQVAGRGRTDDRGRFEVGGLEAGRYGLRIESYREDGVPVRSRGRMLPTTYYPGAIDPSASEEIQVEAGVRTEVRPVYVSPGAGSTLRVSLPSGWAMGSAVLRLSYPDSVRGFWEGAVAEGQVAEIGGLAPGNYVLTARFDSGTVATAVAIGPSDVNLTLSPPEP